MTPRDRLGCGRIRTFDYLPYLASYVYGLKQREASGYGTIGVSKDGTLYWDPKFIETLSVDTMAYVILHEVLHLIFRHHARATEVYGEKPSQTQHMAMNVACDLVVEQTLASLRALRPPGAVYLGANCETLGITLDFKENLDQIAYYRLIMDAIRKNQQPPPCQKRADDGQQSPSGSGDSGSSGTSPIEKLEQSSDGKAGATAGSNGKMAVCSPGSGGSAGDGVRREWEEPDESWEAFQEVVAAGTAEQAIRQAELLNPGSVPGQLKEAISGFLRPQPDPFEKLRSAVASSTAAPLGGRMQTYRRLNRKQPADVCRLRGYLSTQATAVVIVDTSGSMNDRETKMKALQVISDGLRKLTRVKVVCADTRIRSSAYLKSVQNFEWVGGGGTAMDVAIREVEKSDHPDSIVLITDAATAWPRLQPRARVVVALTEDNHYRHSIPGWCKTVPLF